MSQSRFFFFLIKWAYYYLLTGEYVRVIWVNNVKHSAHDLGHKVQAVNNSCYCELQEHFELMAGPTVVNGRFVWLFFFVSFCRGQISHVLMSFVTARGQRTDACLVLCGVWQTCSLTAPSSRLGNEPADYSCLTVKGSFPSWVKYAIPHGSSYHLSNSQGGLDIKPRGGCLPVSPRDKL